MKANIGQLVRLRSGGPEMCVAFETTIGDGSIGYYCQWFHYEELRGAAFSIASLEPIEGEFETEAKVEKSPEAEEALEEEEDIETEETAETEEAEEAEETDHHSNKGYH